MKDRVAMLILLFSLLDVSAQRAQWQDSVMVRKIGSNYIFIFPDTRVTPFQNVAGEITVSRSVAVMYAIKIIRGQSRFIGLDGSVLPPEELAKLKPRLRTINASKNFGFLIRDSIQPDMHIHIEPSFMAGKISTELLQQRIAREGNLTVIFAASKSGQLRILQAILN